MENGAQRELSRLIERLRVMGANELADDIIIVIGRGATEEIEVQGKTKELSQRPLYPEEAYLLAVEMIVSALEPMVMKRDAQERIGEIMGLDAKIVWSEDFVEQSAIDPENYENLVIPDVDGIIELENELVNILTQIGHLK